MTPNFLSKYLWPPVHLGPPFPKKIIAPFWNIWRQILWMSDILRLTCSGSLQIEQKSPFIPRGRYSTLSWVRMCGPKFRTPPYNKTREDANLLPISKPFVSLRALFKTNQCFLQCKLGCISTFWQPVDKPKDKFIGNYAFCKNATYIKTNFQIKKGPLQNLRARKSTLSGPHIPVPTFPLSTRPPPGIYPKCQQAVKHMYNLEKLSPAAKWCFPHPPPKKKNNQTFLDNPNWK